MKCRVCETRAPRRQCPALGAEICAICCGTEREESVSCPLECEYLREARRREKQPVVDPASLPHPEIEVSDRFLEQQQPLAVIAGRLLLISALETQGSVDLDMREALDALTRTYKTAESGLVYEPRPANVIAAGVQSRFQQEIQRFREEAAKRSGTHSIRDADLLKILVFWQRMEWQTSNGRRKGRAFIESLFSLLPPPPEQQSGSPE